MERENPILHYFIFDTPEIQLTDEGKLPHTPQVDFVHQISYYISNSTLNQCGKVHCYIKNENHVVDVSPFLKIPKSQKEFRRLLRQALRGAEVTVGTTQVMRLRKILPELPKLQFSLNPYANKTANPSEVLKDSAAFFMNPTDPSAPKVPEICFSEYPLPVLNQVSNIIGSTERFINVQ